MDPSEPHALPEHKDAAVTADFLGFAVTQKAWRRVGTGALLIDVVLMWNASKTGLIRDSVLHLVSLSSKETQATPISSSGLFCFVYWSIFALLILIALYMALIDFRYIRARFMIQKRAIFRRTLGSKEFRESLLKDRESKGKLN